MRKINFLLFIAIIISLIYIFSTDKEIQSEDGDSGKKIAQEIADKCLKEADKNKCYQAELSNLTKAKDLFFTEKILALLQNIDPFTRSCHVLAHKIAEAETRKDPFRWEELVDQVNVSSCGAGYLHGVLEVHTSENPDFKITKEVIEELCKDGSSEKGRMCAHFLAHILVLQNEGDIDSTIDECTKLRGDLTYDCLDGVFMEAHQKNIMVDHGLVKPPLINTEYAQELANKCNLHEGVVAAGCWTEMAEIFAKASSYDQKHVFEGCNMAKNSSEASYCYLKGVVVLATYPTYNSLEKLKSICKPYDGDDGKFKQCINYMVSAFMHYSLSYMDTAVGICSNIKKDLREGCFKDLGQQLQINVASVSEREELCQGAPNEYKELCASI